MKKLALLACIATGAMFSACSSTTDTPAGPKTVVGQTASIGQGTAKSWVTVDANGVPTSLGITLEEKALVGLPDTMAMFDLAFPSSEIAKTPFNHISTFWNPHGHEPEHVYDKPHFDFHFYTVDMASQMAVVGGPDATPIDTNLYPMGYATDPEHTAIPMMGVHYSPVTDFMPGYNFDQTMIYGFYHGSMYFLEPMITKAYLEGTVNKSFAIPQPATYAYTGKYFPTKYTIVHDASAKTITISFDSLVKR